jgi:hypothetical protein
MKEEAAANGWPTKVEWGLIAPVLTLLVKWRNQHTDNFLVTVGRTWQIFKI